MSNLALLTAQVCRYNCLNKLSYLDFNRAIKQFYTVKPLVYVKFSIINCRIMLLNWLHKLSYLYFNREIKQFYTVKTTCLCQI